MSKSRSLGIVLLGAAIFTFLFWKQGLGLNAPLFVIFIGVFLFITKQLSRINKRAVLSYQGLLITSIFLVINHSAISIFAFFTGFLVFIGLLYGPEIKTVYLAAASAMQRMFSVQMQFALNMKPQKKPHVISRSFYFLKISLIPLVFLVIFHLIFINANPVYGKFSNDIWDSLNFFSFDFDVITLIYLTAFYVFGIFVLNMLVFPGTDEKFRKLEAPLSDDLTRKRKTYFKFKMMALKRENLIGSIMVVMINILLLIVNIIDINWIWFGEVSTDPVTLSQLVHSGTYLLIFSILLSMLIILYFFRRNQNFYAKNKVLKYGAYVWLFQNVILTISVLLRNTFYIQNAGFAYGRINVLFFVLLIMLGLVLMFLKIKNTKSVFYLFRTMSWGVYALMIVATFVNWDVFIANYNIKNHKNGIDRFYLYQLSDKALYVLNERTDEILAARSAENRMTKTYGLNTDDKWRAAIKMRIYEFVQDFEQRDWQSWNYADYRSYLKLKKALD